MGCNDSGQPPAGWSYHDNEKIREMKARLDAATAFLCAACPFLETHVGLRVIPGLAEWWQAHKAEDLKRAEAERDHQFEMRRRHIREAEELEARARELREKARR